ncbi:MAG: Rieske 2Fe-2S domain-containing protein [Flavobacteriales bacterium]|nr:Rieske 2Fe-2S domain-containing protein [Flavobacteriales bacterium]MCB9198269.1 Rieske 2Fe-2S domain-containing protein [Flavobacteriales bacterium]
MSKVFKYLPVILISLLIAGTASCNRNSNQMPYVPVDIYINTNLPAYSNLTIIGGWVYVSGGNNGIIVYRQSYESIVAFERKCTYQLPNSCGYGVVDSTNFYVECDCDGTKYSIFDGSVIEGPAPYSLYQYRSSFDSNSGQLHIYN